MKKWIYLLIILVTFSCKEKVKETYMTPEKAINYFSKIREVCDRDGGKLWGKNLFSPVMFVDRTSRKVVASHADAEEILRFRDGVYTGLYPRENIILITASEFGGTLYGLVPLPQEEDEYRIVSRAIHSLFHVYQKSIGIDPASFTAVNMDEKDARIWIKLEWRALRKALNAKGEEQLPAIRDALIFRGANRETYPKYTAVEDRFETYEGLATFTYLLLDANSPEDFKSRLFEYLDRIYQLPSYTRSYGSIHGALYAALLYDKGFDFKTITPDSADLGKIVREVYKIVLPVVCRDVAGSIAINYNIDEIMQEEEKRNQEIRKVADQVSIFTEKPVVYLELESPYFDFEPEDVHPIDTLGTLYYSLRVADNWGKLTVNKIGCLVSNNYKFMRITARGFKAEKNTITGDGWQLVLNDGWQIAAVGQNYFVRKVMP